MSTQKLGNNGLDNFLMNYTNALEENSKEICEMLEALSTKKLKESEKKSLRSIKSELKRIDKEIDKLG